jgi:hypothetical protein
MNENRFSEHLSNGQAAVATNGTHPFPSPSGREVRGEGCGGSDNGTHTGTTAGADSPKQRQDADKTRRADASTLADGGRDQNGRFVKGNPGGPGNPFAREVAKMRRAFMNRVSIKDLEDIADKMVALAKEGNVQAAKFIYGYMIGKPLPARDPDHLNEHELEVFKTEATFTQEVGPLLSKPEAEVPLMLARQVRSEMTRQAYAQVGASMYYSLPADRRKANAPDAKELQTWEKLRLVPPSAKRKLRKKLKRR